MHHPVLLKSVIDSLEIKKGGKYIDCTYGEGGHSRAILEKGGIVLGIELDRNQFNQQIKTISNPNLKLVNANFRDIEKVALENQFLQADGVIFDYGLSMDQINQSGRGFSFKNHSEPLDMRLNLDSSIKASDVIAQLSPNELYDIIAGYSEDVHSQKITDEIVKSRIIKKIATVGDLIRIIDKVVPNNQVLTYKRIFQALRIAVNNEFNNIKKALLGAKNVISDQGRIAVITFHSLEDRIVKRYAQEIRLGELNKKPIQGDRLIAYEKSAKLRVFVKN